MVTMRHLALNIIRIDSHLEEKLTTIHVIFSILFKKISSHLALNIIRINSQVYIESTHTYTMH